MNQKELKEFITVQVEAIREYQRSRSKEEDHDIGSGRACIEWITKGYAENFRIIWEENHPSEENTDQEDK